MAEETRVDDGEATAAPESADGQATDEAVEQDTQATVVSDEIAALQSQLADASAKHLRLAADFDNYRRRVERDRSEQLARAQSVLISRLLEVVDDLERFAHHADPNVSAETLQQGVQLVERKLMRVLESAGLEPVAAEDERFDPKTMEAVATLPTEDPEQDNTVADVFQKGYRFNGVLVRPARVRVRKHD